VRPGVALDRSCYQDIVRRALAEDLGSGDVTTDAIVPRELDARGAFVAKSPCVLAGLDVAFEVFRHLDAGVQLLVHRRDGDDCRDGETLGEVRGPARTLLIGERTALNFLQRLSGIATQARRFVHAAAGKITVLDTRKTTPTLRALEKYAVRIGGASNHRAGLFDAILIKDNHIRLSGGVDQAIRLVRERLPGRAIEVEVESLDELAAALGVGVETVLVDNLTSSEIREAVRRARGRAKVEVSGGVTLERIPDLADTGADFVSVGALTHSAPAVDISFEVDLL
jgi:nicotinate-nucleotide pyrophosphorylase (carboxylating)